MARFRFSLARLMMAVFVAALLFAALSWHFRRIASLEEEVMAARRVAEQERVRAEVLLRQANEAMIIMNRRNRGASAEQESQGQNAE